MPHAELAAWAEYAQIEPFGSHFDDLRFGAVAAATYNVARDPEKRSAPFLPLDFMPWNALSNTATEPPPRLIADPEAHSRMLDAVLFGKAPD